MSAYETTHHGTDGNSTTVHYADGTVRVGTLKPIPPIHPSTQSQTMRIHATHELTDFVDMVDEVLGYVATDDDTPVYTRGQTIRFTLGDLNEAVRRALSSGEDLTDADTRLDWCLSFAGLEEEEYREVASALAVQRAEEAAMRRRESTER